MVARRSLLHRCLLPLSLLGFAACAKTGDPQPPQLRVPKPAADLAARQFSDRILLTVTPPAVNADGSPAVTLGRVDAFRLQGDSRSDAGPVPEDAFLTRGVKILSVPAADFTRHLRDGTLALWDVSAAADPAAFYARSFRYAVLFFNRKNQTAGLSNQAFLAPLPIPAAPADLSGAFFPDLIRLSWTPPDRNVDGSVPPRIAGYNVYRTEDPKAFPSAPLNAEPLARPEFEVRDFEFDKVYHFAVSVVGSRANPYAESLASPLLRVAPVDTFPPGVPTDLTAVVENGTVTLLWGPPDDADLAGYRVFRREEGGAERTLLQAQLVTTLSYRDDQVRRGRKYEYIIVAVDTHGNESQAATRTVEVQ
jgi:hypothetical protein